MEIRYSVSATGTPRRKWRRSEEFLCVFPSDLSLTLGPFSASFSLISLGKPDPNASCAHWIRLCREAGGGSRHIEFGIGRERIGAAEWYDVEKDEWLSMDEELPGVRAGCFGFFLRENEFWVIGGYGDCRTVSGVFPVDDYYRDGAVLSLKNWKWKSTESKWEERERGSLGSVAVVEDELGGAPGIFMLDGAAIFSD